MPDIKYIETTDIQTPAQAIADQIRQQLAAGRPVFWLVSGGSAIAVAVLARKLLGDIGPEKHLGVGLVDERFGPVGHANSNWQQLLTAGFDTTGLQTYPFLADNTGIAETTTDYNSTLEKLLTPVTYSLGLFGIGADGHTAGLLPHSPLFQTNNQLVGQYQATDYLRISVTPRLIEQLDEIDVYACGEAKWPVLEQLQHSGAVSDTPARLLWGANSTTVYTDWQGA